MAIRWRMLAILFFVRTAMGFQFQAIAAVSPLVAERFGVGLAEIGLLIGLYLAPGIVIALPGGALGRAFGDRRMVGFGLVLMILGGILAASSADWNVQIAARVLAGIGGVILNVVMSKMVTDLFAGREIATAMAIFVNSWPVGIAIALLALPPVAVAGGLVAAMWVVVGAVVLGLVLLLAAYRAPEVEADSGPARARLGGNAFAAALVAGMIWGLYNAGLTTVFGFGPAMLTERGWSLGTASSATSIVLWIAAASIPLGGLLADRLGRRGAVLLAGVIGFAALLHAASVSDGTTLVVLFVLMGVFAGLPPGPIMSLPAQVLDPGTRALGMGIFYTCFYVFTVLGPVVAGWIAEWAGTAAAALQAGMLMELACVALYVIFLRLARRVRAMA